MVKKPKKIIKVAKTGKIIWIFFLSAFFLIIAIFLLQPIFTNKSYYSTDKDMAETKLKKTIDNLKLPGSTIYSNVSDIGCDSRNSVGLQSRIHCELTGEIYYQSHGDSKTELSDFNKRLDKEGWTATYYNADSDSQRTIAASKGEATGSRPYISAESRTNLILYFERFRDESAYIDSAQIKELIDDKKIPRPAIGESIYGIYITKTYWTCSSKYLFISLCPKPPSKPE